ncbi:CU044_5270 family protein [Streptosporangium sp. CA-135522]|uniref:CU044_5270 family protein n=1 Tax=Streptosporangium sp. CA-135522 TaxID=3240072 RepID=UPI003D8C9379
MNPIDELRAARPAHLGDAPVDQHTRATELSYAMAQARPARSARRRRGIARPMWGLSLAGAAAAVTAVAVVATGTGGTAPRAPSGSQAAPTGDQAESTRQVQLSARAVLLAAAHRADRQRDETGAYWHTTSVRRSLFKVEGADYAVMDRERIESWTPSATGRKQEQRSRTQTLGALPASPQDEAAWKQAGSPAKIPVVVPGKRGAKLALSTTPGAVQYGHSALFQGDKVFWLGRNVTMKDLRGLPSEPGRLKAWLLRSYEGHGTESSSDPMSSDAWLFAVTVGLITDMPVTPQVRGAAFRMLADLETIKVIDDVTDAEGRTGTAVAIDEHVKAKAAGEDDGAILQNRLIFDEETGQALANENVVVEPGGLQADLAPGTVWNSQTVLDIGWTDDKPAT